MSLVLFAAAALAQSQPVVEVEGMRQGERHDVGYAELMDNRPADAIAIIRANRSLSADDPARLINLGTAHARLGHRDKARDFYMAAIASDDRYDVELAGGTWMDSRAAARRAIAGLSDGKLLVLR